MGTFPQTRAAAGYIARLARGVPARGPHNHRNQVTAVHPEGH